MSNIALRSLASIIVLSLLVSCENEYSEVGTDFIKSIDIQPPYESDNLTTYSEKHKAIQANNLRSYFIGEYSDPVYGSSEAKLLTQLSLLQTNPDFGTDPVVDSVVLTLPYFSTQTEEELYELDSVYGSGSFKLNIYESNQFLRDINPGDEGDFQDNQLYFTNQLDDFSPNIASTPFVTSQTITPSTQTAPLTLLETTADGTLDTLSLSPRMRVKLPVSFFENKIINAQGSEVLASNSAFKNYMRGFLIEAVQQISI